MLFYHKFLTFVKQAIAIMNFRTKVGNNGKIFLHCITYFDVCQSKQILTNQEKTIPSEIHECLKEGECVTLRGF